MAQQQKKEQPKNLKQWIISIIVVAIAGYFGIDLLDSEDTKPSKEGLIPVELVRVVDGDTIRVKYEGEEKAVRYLLVDTPETVHPKKTTERFGPEASNFMKELMKDGKVEIEFDVGEKEDKYGRLLAYIYVDGESVQEMLLRKGLARVAFVYPPNDSYVTRFKEIEAEAKKNKCGIWSLEGYVHARGFDTERYPYDEKSKKDIQKVCD